jgi:hypothetical protein
VPLLSRLKPTPSFARAAYIAPVVLLPQPESQLFAPPLLLLLLFAQLRESASSAET